jgi:hypothetical protein
MHEISYLACAARGLALAVNVEARYLQLGCGHPPHQLRYNDIKFTCDKKAAIRQNLT